MQNLIFLLLVGLFASGLQAQNCNCDHVLSGLSTTDINIIHASSIDYQPGDVFCIEAGQIAGLRLHGFRGTATQPLTFKNCGGKVVIDENPHAGITFIESEYVHLTGTGDPATQYGFHIVHSGHGQVGISVRTFSSDVEIDHVEIENTGFAGIMAKTDPRCDNPATWRSNGYVLRNLDIHHNYIHHTAAEGIYVGYSGGYKVNSNVFCNGQPRFGHWLENVEIHHNLLENTGWDGIQMSLVRSNGKVHDNRVLNWATQDEFYQDFVFNLTGGTYEVYNNFLQNTGGNDGKGMQVISAQSGSKFYNNTLIEPALHGIFFHARHAFDNPTEAYYIVNNTVVRPGASGFFYDAEIKESNNAAEVGTRQNDAELYFVNNLVVSPGSDYGNFPTWKLEPESFFDFNTPDTRDAHLPTMYGNFTTRRSDTIGVTNPSEGMYAPLSANSVLVDRGSSALPFNITFDIMNVARPLNGAFDIGAYEYQYGTTTSTSAAAEAPSFGLYPNPSTPEQLTIDLTTTAEIFVHNTVGQSLYRKRHPSGRQRLEVGSLPAGTYLVSVRSGKQLQTRKLILY